MFNPELAVVMPVFNEEAAIVQVVEEWILALSKIDATSKLLLLNDGSTDHTADALNKLKTQFPQHIDIHSHTNRGHGQTCIRGYQLALEMGATWILQIDSDGQCDPQYVDQFWQARCQHQVVFGYRTSRGDGLLRWLISRVVSMTVWSASGVWIKDANVPYRLIHHTLLARVVPQIPEDFYLANILVSVFLQRLNAIHWIPIHFRTRLGGSSTLRLTKLADQGLHLFLQLRKTIS